MAKKDIQYAYKNDLTRRPYFVGGEIFASNEDTVKGNSFVVLTVPKSVVIGRVIVTTLGTDAVTATVADEKGLINVTATAGAGKEVVVKNVNKFNADANNVTISLGADLADGNISVLVEYIDKEVTTGGSVAIKKAE